MIGGRRINVDLPLVLCALLLSLFGLAMVFSARIDSLQPSSTASTAAAVVFASTASPKSSRSRRRIATVPNGRSRSTG